MNNQLISGVTLPSAWSAYNTQDPNNFQLLHRQLWFTRTYTSAVTTSLPMFDVLPANNTDDLATNIFPYQNSYLLKALGIYFKVAAFNDAGGANGAFASIFRDVQLLVNTGVLDVKIGKVDYGPFALWRLSAGGGVFGVMAAAGAKATNDVYDSAQVGMPNPDAIFKLAIPLVIPANTQAFFKLRWPAGAVTLGDGNPATTLLLEGIEAAPA